MCLYSCALSAGGTGDRIEPRADWPVLPMVLVWPGRPVSTPLAFAGLKRRENPPLPPAAHTRNPAEFASWLRSCRNDLEAPALELVPEIGEALVALRSTPGCLLARMSGSGSGCFAIYSAPKEARAAAEIVREGRPAWWVSPASANAA
jgi:4-diphosphocytidyl-2-C-methyl-D-erythritol kinase